MITIVLVSSCAVQLADAYEEVEEQRQVVAQWKRKHQKMTNEMNDLRMLLEEQNGRNNVLEKRQRKFDAECVAIKDAARMEKQAKEKLAQEKEILIAEKFTLEQNLAVSYLFLLLLSAAAAVILSHCVVLLLYCASNLLAFSYS